MGQDGAQVIRLPYRGFLPLKLMRKLRLHPGVHDLLNKIKPDVVLFHGLCGWELHAVARYKRENPEARLYVDSHEDQNNSARSFVSRNLLHRIYYAWIVRRCRHYFDKILCVSLETMEFVRQIYGVPPSELEFYPLGGRVFDDLEYADRRGRGRHVAGVDDKQVMLLQTGKMGRRKKVLESLRSFAQAPGSHLRFILVGSLDEEIRSEVEQLIASDARVRFLGWRAAEELNDLLCAADVYVQPGTQSATMQMGLCARCPVILDDVPSHKPFVDGNGWLVRSADELAAAFRQVEADPVALDAMSGRSLAIAAKLLDYRTLAARVLK
jgi:glycosyltransferase involved in cell wall biosynthesis